MSISMGDESLLKRWLDARDADAFKVLCSRHGGMVYATCVRILRDEAEAEDVAQSCFESLSGLRKGPRGPLGPWLHRVATNRALDVLKSGKRRKAREERFAEGRDLRTEILWEDIYDFVDEAIEELPEKLRVAVVGHFIEDETHESIARREGVSRAAITQRIQRGVQGIRKTLKRRGIPVTSLALGALLAAEKALAMPPSLTASLGRLALAGTPASIAAKAAGRGFAGATPIPAQGSISTIGGTGMKTKAVCAAGIVLAILSAGIFMALSNGPEEDLQQVAVSDATNQDGLRVPAESTEEETPSLAETEPPGQPAPAVEVRPPRITGLVLDPDGEPVEGASLLSRNGPALAKTDAEGRFEVDTLPKDTGQLSLDAQGFENVTVNSLVTMWDGPVHVEAMPRKLLKRMIRVVDAKGQPVEGAEIRAANSPQVVAATDPEGWFEAPSHVVSYIASHPAIGTTKINYYDHPAGGTVRLTPPAKIRIRVEQNGTPVSGAEIRRRNWQSRSNETRVTGEDGTVMLEGLDSDAGTVLLNAKLEQPDGTLLHGTALARLEAGATTECVIALRDPFGGVLRGRLLWDDGSPVEGGRLQVQAQANSALVTSAKMRAGGYFEAPLFLGENTVYESNLGCALVDPEAWQILAAPGATEHYVELRLVRKVAQESEDTFAMTLDYGERPRPKRLMLLANDWFIRSNLCWVDAPDDNEVLLHFGGGNAPNRLIAVDAEHGYGGFWVQWVEPKTTTLRLDVPLTTVSGVLLDQRGERIAYGGVSAHSQPDFPGVGGQANGAGEFTLWPVPAGRNLTLTASAAGCQPGTLVVRAGETSGTLRITMARRESVLAGQVVYEDGSPVMKGHVACYQDPGPDGVTPELRPSVLNGTFRQVVAAGTWNLVARDDFAQSETLLAQAPAENLLLVLPDRRPFGDDTLSAERQESQDFLKQFAIIFKMFANESRGEVYPRLSRVPGGFYPEISRLYPEYLTDPEFVVRVTNQAEVRVSYLGHMVDSEEAAMAFLDAYTELGPEAIRESDLLVAEGLGTFGGDTIYRLSEGLSPVDQSTVPIMWELPGPGRETGGYVLYMDGHVEWVPYPGKFPMSEAFVARMLELQAESAP